MADLSKLRFNGTDYNVKDASAPLRKFTNYSKTGNLPITSDDTTQTAIGKLEKALDSKINTSAKGTASGVAELDTNGKVPSSQLPSYVDDVLEYSAKSSFPATGETGKIYVDTTTNKTYRWSGSAYVEISESLALGETSSTAYRGDRGKAAYNHSQITNGNPHGTTGANTNLTGYSKGSSKDAVTATDTVNAAIAKHENRINANQTNILYTLNRTGKNCMDLQNPYHVLAFQGQEAYTNGDNGSVTITDTNTTWSSYRVIGYVKPNTAYKLVTYVSNFSSAVSLFVKESLTSETNLAQGSIQGNGTITTDITTGSSNQIRIYYNLNNSATAKSNSITLRAMLVEASTYAIDSTYVVASLPNYDLTRLEAEDRASLAEVVDSGAKNLINCSVDNIKSLNSTSLYSWNGNAVTAYGRTATVNADGTITVAAGTGSAEFWLKVANYTYASGVSYVLSGCPANGSTTTYHIESDNLNLRDIGSGVVINSATTDALYIVVRTTGSTPALTFKPMLCTKAAFGVSQKFVPYAKSNYQLTTDMGNVNAVLEAVL